MQALQPHQHHQHCHHHSHSNVQSDVQVAGLTKATPSHHDPWSHPFICCDVDHAASTSTSNVQQPSALYTSLNGTNGNVISQNPTPNFPSGQTTPAEIQQACPMYMYICNDDACHDGQVECCEKVDCDDATTNELLPGLHGNTDDCHECGLDELEAWACTKEGCHAIQQYLECCKQLDCTLPSHSGSIVNQHHGHHVHHHMHDTTHHTSPNTAYTPNTPWNTQNHPFTPSSTLPSPSGILPQQSTTVIPTHVCHWQNCHRVYSSMPDLLAHVAADHLGAPGFLNEPGKAEESVSTIQSIQEQPTINSHASQALFDNALIQTFNPNNFGGAHQVLSTQSSGNGLNDAIIQADPLASMLIGQQNPFNTDAGQELLSCLWDDCLPLPECTAPEPEACPTHSHMPAHPIGGHSHTNATGEPFSPQTMLRHVLEEHLGVPGAILGWGETGAPPDVPNSTPTIPMDHAAIKKAHDKLHAPHHHHLPTPSSTPQSPSPPPAKPLICLWPGCTHSEAFLDPGTLMAHLSDEHVGRGKDSYTCQWDGCDRTFRSRQKVLRHLQSHTGHRPFICPVCEQAFGEAAPLAAHMRRHAQEKPFKCEYPGCGKTFAISSSLTIHMRTHNGEKPFVCPHCSKGFVEASNLTKHIRTHTGERPFACPFPGCGKRFPRPDQLKRHMGVHDNGSVTGRRGSKGKAVGLSQ